MVTLVWGGGEGVWGEGYHPPGFLIILKKPWVTLVMASQEDELDLTHLKKKMARLEECQRVLLSAEALKFMDMKFPDDDSSGYKECVEGRRSRVGARKALVENCNPRQACP